MQIDVNSGVDGSRGAGAGRAWIVAGLIGVLSAAHFLAPPDDARLHAFLFKATFLPLVMAGLWMGLRGALIASAATVAIYVAHVFVQLVPADCHDTDSIFMDVGLLILMSLVAGSLSDRHARALIGERQRAEELARTSRSLRSAEESLRRSDRLRALGELSAGLAHEIRNPLGGIRGAADILARPASTQTTRDEFAGILRSEVERLDRVVESFLGFARPPEGRPGPVAVRDLCQSVLLLLRGEAGLAEVELELEEGPQVRAWADADLLRQALLNVLLNALQAAAPGGSVKVRVGGMPGPTIDIEDSGPGIPPDLLDRIFDPFVTGRAQGTGLGLALAHRLMEAMGGSIEVVRTDASGTRMRLRMPEGRQQSSASVPVDGIGTGGFLR